MFPFVTFRLLLAIRHRGSVERIQLILIVLVLPDYRDIMITHSDAVNHNFTSFYFLSVVVTKIR